MKAVVHAAERPAFLPEIGRPFGRPLERAAFEATDDGLNSAAQRGAIRPFERPAFTALGSGLDG